MPDNTLYLPSVGSKDHNNTNTHNEQIWHRYGTDMVPIPTPTAPNLLALSTTTTQIK